MAADTSLRPINVIVISSEGDPSYWKHLQGLPNCKLKVVPHLLQERINSQQSQVFKSCEVEGYAPQIIVLASPSKSILTEHLFIIRSHPKLALAPVLALTPLTELGPARRLADKVSPPTLSAADLYSQILALAKLTSELENFSPVGDNDDISLRRLINLLRFLHSRQNMKLSPDREKDSPCGYVYPLAAALLDAPQNQGPASLEDLEVQGFLTGRLQDRIHLCPQCEHYQINFREVCPRCRIPHIQLHHNIHHYRCSYVGPEIEFQRPYNQRAQTHDQWNLVCPKCMKKLKDIGVDYDRPSTSYVCFRCSEVFLEPTVNCLCMNCGGDFSTDKAKLQDIKIYSLTAAGSEVAEQGLGNYKLTDPDICNGLLPFEIFTNIFHIQFGISRRSNRPLCLASLTWENVSSQGSSGGNDQGRWLMKLGAGLRENLRGHDAITLLDQSELLILSPETNKQEAGIALNRALKKSEELIPPGFRLQRALAELPREENKLSLLIQRLRFPNI